MNPKLYYGMNIETARKYVEIRHKIDKLVDRIYAFSDISATIQDLHLNDFDPSSICFVAGLIKTDIMKINECLDDDFCSIAAIELILEKEG